MGYDMHYSSPSEIWDELAGLSPILAGINYARIDNEGLAVAVPERGPSGDEVPARERFASGHGKFHAVEYSPPREVVDSDYPWLLSTGRTLYHYNVGTMTRRVHGLASKSPDCFVEINPKDLAGLGCSDGAMSANNHPPGQPCRTGRLDQESETGPNLDAVPLR